jgi:hypothetical protein
MKVKSQEFIDLKLKIIQTIKLFDQESNKFEFPIDDETDFLIFVEECKVIPVFVKKDNYLKVEYDFTLCNTKIRRLAFSKLFDSIRIEISLK